MSGSQGDLILSIMYIPARSAAPSVAGGLSKSIGMPGSQVPWQRPGILADFQNSLHKPMTLM